LRPRVCPGLSWLRPYQFAWASARELAAEQFDLVVGLCPVWHADVHVALNGCRSALLDSSQQRYRSAGARALWRLAKRLNPRQWVYRAIERKQFGPGSSTLVIAPSHRVAEQFRRWHSLGDERLAVVHLGIELDRTPRNVEQARDAFRRQRGLAAGDVAILFAARNYSLKGLEPLLLSFKSVAAACDGARLLVCGSDRDGRYRRLARRLGLGDRVRFLGFVDDVRECFAGVDVFVLPTFYDACSLVVLEALAAGVPVVTTRSNGASELVSDGVDGFIIDSPWDSPALSNRLRRLASDATLRRRMSVHARTHAERLSIHASVQKMLGVLQTRLHPVAVEAEARGLIEQSGRRAA